MMTQDSTGGGATGTALASKATALISDLIGDLDKAREEAARLLHTLAATSGGHRYQLAERDGGSLRRHADSLAKAMDAVSSACENDAMHSLLLKLRKLGDAEDALLRGLAEYSGIPTVSPAPTGAEVSTGETREGRADD
jgi:hypothetical protein